MAKSDSLLGTTLEEYRLESLLGQGGMARVYRGIDTRLNRYVAIKVIDKQFRDDGEYARRFQLEAQAIAQLQHPHIVSLYRYGDVNDMLYMAMQYVEGSDVSVALEQYEQFGEYIAPKEALQIIRQTGQALDYVHGRGIIHRDIKPSNIMLDKDGNAILTDFGLALMTDVGTRGEIFGTPNYLSPEQAISSASVVPQSDIYSLGVIAYRMFTGEVPFEADEPLDIAMMHLNDEPPNPLDFRPELSEVVADVLLHALAKNPTERFQTGKDLADALETAIQSNQKPVSAPRMTIPQLVKVEITENPLPPVPAVVDETPVQKIPEQVSITDRLAETAEHVAEPTVRNPIVNAPAPAPRMVDSISKVEEKSALATYLPYGIGGIIVALLAIFAIFSLMNNTPNDSSEPTSIPMTTINTETQSLRIEANSDSALLIINETTGTTFNLDRLQFDNTPQEGGVIIANWSGGQELAPNQCVIITTINVEFTPSECDLVNIYEVGTEVAIWNNTYAVSYQNDLNPAPILMCQPNSRCDVPIMLAVEN